MENLKKVLAFPLAAFEAYEQANEDGELTYGDLVYLGEPAMKLFPALGALPEAWAEFKGATPEEMDEVKDWAKSEFDLEDDVLEKKIEDSVEALVALAKAITGWVPPTGLQE